ncbi:hypothetical protein ACNS7O_18015 (plasmid) [Haloferacaceae archaeon DSL9]
MPPDQRYWRNDDRELRPRKKLTGVDRFLTDTIYYGLGQVLLLCAPALWVVFQTPGVGNEATAAASISLLTVPLCIGVFRSDRTPLANWPKLTNAKLGTGRGYPVFLTRLVYLSCTILLATYAATLLQLATGSLAAGGLAAVTFSAASLVLLPSLSRTSRRARRFRFGFYIGSLAVAAVGSSAYHPRVGDPIATLVVVGLLALAVLDVRYR